jgi:diacylglycerol kinase (ATP)
MKCIFIYNPNSGKRKIKANIDYIESRLRERFTEVVIYETKSQKDLIDTAADSCDIYDAIFFSGGDGAFNNIIQGIMRKPNRPPLGYIPAGTVCDIGRNIGSSKNIKKALDIMLNGEIVTYDVGYSNGKYFAYTETTGTFVSTSVTTSGEKKKKLGKLAYYLGAIGEFFKPTIRKLEFQRNGTMVKINSPLLLILNSRSVGGFPVNRKAKLNSGKFDIYIIKNSNNRISGAINVIFFYLRGFLGMKMTPIAYHLRETKFKVVSEENIVWTLDGEDGPRGNIEVEYIPNAYRLYVNPKCINRFGKR